MAIPDSVLDEIRTDAKEAWPDDKEMQSFTVKEEIESYRHFESIDLSAVSESMKQMIISGAKENFDTWEEIASSVEDEVEAIEELRNVVYPNIDKEIIDAS